MRQSVPESTEWANLNAKRARVIPRPVAEKPPNAVPRHKLTEVNIMFFK